MFVAGIDAHATYCGIAVVSNTGQLVRKPIRIKNREADRLDNLLEQFRPLEVIVTKLRCYNTMYPTTTPRPRPHWRRAILGPPPFWLAPANRRLRSRSLAS